MPTGCTLKEDQNIALALALARKALTSTAVADAIVDYQFDGSAFSDNSVYQAPEWGTAYPEWLLKRMLEPIDTIVYCNRGGAITDGTIKDDPPESIGIGGDALLPPAVPDIQSLAGLILHEVAHTKGLFHEFGYDYDNIPLYFNVYIPDYLSGKGLPVIRSVEPRETTLAPVGADDGFGWNEQVCVDDRFARGVAVIARSGLPPDDLAIQCSHTKGTGNDWLTAWAGYYSPNGTYSSSLCPSGQIMVGAYGFSDAQLGSIGPLCADLGTVRNGSSVSPPDENMPRVGADASMGLHWRRQCPTGMAVRSVRSRSGQSYVSRIELVCQQISMQEPIVLNPWRGPEVANPGHGRLLERCPGRQAVSALFAIYDSSHIIRVRGECRRIFGSGSSARLDGVIDQIVPAHGGNGRQAGGEGVGTPYGAASCPEGYLLIGLNTQIDPWKVGGIAGVCADIRRWGNASISENSTLWELTPWGIAGGSWTEYRCNRGEYLVGWWIGDWNGLTGIQGICRPFSFN
jgi:hypothetical protein